MVFCLEQSPWLAFQLTLSTRVFHQVLHVLYVKEQYLWQVWQAREFERKYLTHCRFEELHGLFFDRILPFCSTLDSLDAYLASENKLVWLLFTMTCLREWSFLALFWAHLETLAPLGKANWVMSARCSFPLFPSLIAPLEQKPRSNALPELKPVVDIDLPKSRKKHILVVWHLVVFSDIHSFMTFVAQTRGSRFCGE